MFEATRLASYLSRIRGPDYREWLTAGGAFTLATAGSARVLGFGGELGAIAPNAFADLVFLDLGHINYIPLRDAEAARDGRLGREFCIAHGRSPDLPHRHLAAD